MQSLIRKMIEEQLVQNKEFIAAIMVRQTNTVQNGILYEHTLEFSHGTGWIPFCINTYHEQITKYEVECVCKKYVETKSPEIPVGAFAFITIGDRLRDLK